LPFTREIYIDQNDFKEEYSKKLNKKLSPGKRVRLRNGYVIEAIDFVKNDSGEVVQVNASLVPDTLGTDPADGVKPKGVVHWVSAQYCVDCDVYLYDRLFSDPLPDAGDKNFLDAINPDSLQILTGCKTEVGLIDAEAGQPYQFEREGYFCKDSKNSSAERLVFNQTIALRST